MLKRFISAIILLLWGITDVFADSINHPSNFWQPDTAGLTGYMMHRFDQGTDYSGAIRSTVVYKPSAVRSIKGIIYIHGFNDYFFQQSLGDSCVAHGYNFYAVDLRKYGRSILPGQKPFMTRSMKEYFPDIDSTLAVMRRQGVREIVLMGHSTGGLLAAYYMAEMTRRDTSAISDIDCVILNSPFLDWNLGATECVLPMVAAFGKIAPNMKIKNGGEAYAASLLESKHGEWNYNTEWKRSGSNDVNLGWVRAITQAQRSLRRMKQPIKVPVLLMYSARSVNSSVWTTECQEADAVLDVNDMRQYGPLLGDDVTSVAFRGGLHDLILSRPAVRAEVYRYMFGWLNRNVKSSY